MYKYTFNGDYDYRTPNKLNKQQIQSKIDELTASGAFDPEAREQEQLGYEALLGDTILLNHVRNFKNATTGEDWNAKSDEETLEAYYQTMRDINHNSMSALKLSGYMMGDKFNEDERFAIREMMGTWDKVVPFYQDNGRKWRGFLDLVESYGTDPLLYAGIGTGGLATFGGQAAKQVALRGIKKAAMAYGTKAAKFGAIEGAVVGGVHNTGVQSLEKEIGMRDEIDLGELGKASLFGGAAGLLLGGAIGAGVGTFRGAKMAKLKDSGVEVAVSEAITKGQTKAVNKVKSVKGGGKEVTTPDGQVYKVVKAEDGTYQIVDANGKATGAFKKQREAVESLEAGSKDKIKQAKRKDGDLTPDELAAAEAARKKAIAGQRLEAQEELAIQMADEQVKREARREAYDAFIERIDQSFVTTLAGKGVASAGGKRTAKQEAVDAQAILKNYGMSRDNFDLDELAEQLSYDLAPQVRQVSKDGSVSYIDKPKPQTNLKKGTKKYKKEQLVNLGMEVEHLALERVRESWMKNHPDFVEHYDTFEKLMLSRMEVGSEAGRTLNYMKNINRMRTHHIEQMMEAVATVSHSPKAIMDALEKVSQTKLKPYQKVVDVINEFFVHNILTAGSTMAVNTISSAINMHMRSLDDIVGGALTLNKQQITRGGIELYGVYSNLWSASKAAFETLVTAKQQINPRKMYAETVEGGDIAIGNRDYDLKRLLSRDFRDEFKTANESIGMATANVIGNLNRAIGKRMMLTSDEFVKQMTFRSTLLGDVAMQNMKKGMKYKEAISAAQKEVSELSDNHIKRMAEGQTPENAMTRNARDRADAATFQDDFKDDIFGMVGRGSNKIRQTIPLLTVVMPFIRTPANLLSFAGQRTPILNAFSKELREQISQGGEAAARAEAALVTGTMLWALAGFYAVSGQITGPDATDRGRRNVARTAGVLPYSFVGEDGTHTQINRYDPLARPFMTMGAIGDVFKYGTNDEQKNLFGDLVLAFAKTSLSMPSLQGVSRIFDMATETEGKTAGSKIEAFAGQTMRSFMPYYRLIDELNSFSDDLQLVPEVRTIGDAFDGYGSSVNKLINGQYQNSNVKRDPIFGEPIERNEMWYGISGLAYKPKHKSQKHNEVMYELHDRLGVRVNNLPPKHPVLGMQDLRRIQAGPDTNRTLYDVLQEYVGTVKFEGVDLLTALHNEIKSGHYNSIAMTDFDRTSGMPVLEGKGTRVDELKDIISAYRRYAIDYMVKEAREDTQHPLHKSIKMMDDRHSLNGVFHVGGSEYGL